MKTSWLTACMLAVFALTGCSNNEPVLLGIMGYNHTERYIDSFSVNGQGGGNAYPMSGGARVYCCMGYRRNLQLPIEMEVEWTFGYKRNEQGEIVVPSETHKKKAILDGPVPEDPQNLEVHFMPDGTVQLRITSMPSPEPKASVQQGAKNE